MQNGEDCQETIAQKKATVRSQTLTSVAFSVADDVLWSQAVASMRFHTPGLFIRP